ncbi:MAG: c-type cytochrome [Saprospiraceae bacterium]
MKKIIIFFLLAALVTACSSSDTQQPASAAKMDGKSIYKTYCIACHGLYGDMGGSGAFDLTKSTLPLQERIQVITEGRKLMTPFKGMLSEEKIKAVAEYIETLRQ